MFFICKDRCMCTAPGASSPGAGDPYTNPTVLYCFGEVRTLTEEEDTLLISS